MSIIYGGTWTSAIIFAKTIIHTGKLDIEGNIVTYKHQEGYIKEMLLSCTL